MFPVACAVASGVRGWITVITLQFFPRNGTVPAPSEQQFRKLMESGIWAGNQPAAWALAMANPSQGIGNFFQSFSDNR